MRRVSAERVHAGLSALLPNAYVRTALDPAQSRRYLSADIRAQSGAKAGPARRFCFRTCRPLLASPRSPASMMRSTRYTLAILSGAALLASCSDVDALTSPIGTTVATVHQAESRGGRFLVVFEGAPPVGFGARVSRLGGTVEWIDRRGAAVVIGGLSDGGAVSLLRSAGVAGVRRVE